MSLKLVVYFTIFILSGCGANLTKKPRLVESTIPKIQISPVSQITKKEDVFTEIRRWRKIFTMIDPMVIWATQKEAKEIPSNPILVSNELHGLDGRLLWVDAREMRSEDFRKEYSTMEYLGVSISAEQMEDKEFLNNFKTMKHISVQILESYPVGHRDAFRNFCKSASSIGIEALMVSNDLLESHDFINIDAFPELRYLNIEDTKINNEGLLYLQKNTKLET